MQKTATLKKFKVFLLKTIAFILVLSLPFGVSYGQETMTKPAGAKKGEPTARPEVDPRAQQAGKSQNRLFTKPATQAAAGIAGPTDVPEMNKIIAEKTKNSVPFVPNGATGIADVCTFNGSLDASDLALNAGRPFRSGVSATCAAPTTCGGAFGTGPYYYDTYTMQNLTCAAQCVTVTYIANAGGGDAFVSAFNGSFNPANLCTNWIADGGSSSLAGGASVTFSFNLAANATVVLVVNGAQPSTACPSYTMTVTGINCTPPPPCVPPTSTVLSQAGGIPVASTVFTETFDGTIPPANWPVQNLSSPLGVTGWSQTNSAVFPPNTGVGFASANFNNTAGVGTISNWLFTPNVTLKNGDKFSFFTRTFTGAFPDRLQVRMSTNGTSTNVGTTATSTGDFSSLLLDINPTYTTTGYPTSFTKYTLTMSGLPAAGVSGRLAFRYFVENGGPSGVNSDFIGIDDATYTTFTTNPVTTCTGSTANLIATINGGNGAAYNVTINAAPGGNFTVPNYVSGNLIPVTPTGATTYTLVSVIQADNPCCVGAGNTGTVTITPSATTTLPLQITAAPNTTLCAGSPTLLTVGLAPSTGVSTTASGNINLPIPDNSPAGVSTNLTVSGIPATAVVTGMGVLFNITHTWDGDVTLFLKSPNNQVLNLVNAKGGSGDNFINTNITSTATTAIPAAGAPFTGTFKPDGSLTALAPTGFTPTATTFTPLYATNGTWSLGARDAAATDVGSITNWTLTINYNVPAGPMPPGYTFFWSPAAGLSNVTQGQVGASPMTTTTYTVLGTAPGGCQTTASYTVNINQLPAVTVPPTNLTVCAGAPATFTATGTGAGATYQWQLSTNGGTTWANIPVGAPYSGTTTQTLTVNPTTALMHGYRYRMVVSGTCAPAATSASATLSVNALPVVTFTPASPVCGGIAGTSGTQITAGSAPPPVPGTATFTTGPISVAVPDNNVAGATSTLAASGIPANATITGASVTFNMTHTWDGDMVFVLKAPNGNILNLDYYLTATGGTVATTGFVNTKISSAGTASLSSGSNPYTGTFKPDAAGPASSPAAGPTGFLPTVGTFPGLYSVPNGTWTLAMYDGGGGDLGTLTNWSLTIDYTTPGVSASPLTYTWSPALGLFSDPNAIVPYVAGTQTNTVYAAPTNYTFYTITGTDGTTGCVNTAQVLVNYMPPAPTVIPNPVAMCATDTAVRLTSSTSSTVVKTFTSGTISVPVPEGAFPAPPATAGVSTIAVSNIPANAVITGISVTSNFTHAYVGDVVMVLKAPNGQIINLDAMLNKTNNAGANFVNTEISSSGTALLSSGTAPFTGTFKADLVPATFTAFGFTLAGGPVGYAPTATTWNSLYSTPNGNWTIATYDVGAPDIGTLTKWDLKITYSVGTPANPAKWSPIAGLFTNAAGTVAYTGDRRDTVWTRPAGTTTYSVTVDGIGPDATPAFNFASAISTGDGSAGNPYPANVTVSGLPTSGAKVKSVVLRGLSHTWSDDIDVLLQSPTGTNVTLMSDVGFFDILTNVTYTIDDAGVPMDINAGNPTGTYRPTNSGAADTYPAPGPGAVSDASPALANFTGNFNGVWKLFVVDDTAGDTGSFAGGYTINFVYPTIGCTSAATLVPVKVDTPITITKQPDSAKVCTDKVTTFAVTVKGTSPIYQWQVSTDAGNTFANVANGGVYSGATTATLTVTAPPVSMNGYIYRCSVRTPSCGAVLTLQRPLLVSPLPTVVISAAPYTKLLPGVKTTLSSTVSPIAATYTWFKNGATVSGAGAGTLTVDVDGLGDYTLEVKDVNGCINTSNTISITDSVSGKVFIYPNPNSGQFQVRYHSSANNVGLPRGINIYDSRGKQLSTQSYPIASPYARMDVDLRNHGAGIYWIEVVDLSGNRLAIGRAEVLR